MYSPGGSSGHEEAAGASAGLRCQPPPLTRGQQRALSHAQCAARLGAASPGLPLRRLCPAPHLPSPAPHLPSPGSPPLQAPLAAPVSLCYGVTPLRDPPWPRAEER